LNKKNKNMLVDLVQNTNLLDFLTQYDLSQVRGTSRVLKTFIDNISQPRTYTWIQKCRFCNPDMLWEIDHCPNVSCYKPPRKKWVMMYWSRKLPSIIPPSFWNYFMNFVKGYMTLSKFETWHPFQKEPLWFPCHCPRWEIRMRVDIIGTSSHNEEDDYPEELRNIDEFLSVGISLVSTRNIHDGILGLNSFSIGWHSDDGNLYMDSLLIHQGGEGFGKDDQVEVVVDYFSGMLLFKKNSQVVYLYELSGEFLCNPLLFSVSGKTMNSIFLSIL
jgi:hypothetical protein